MNQARRAVIKAANRGPTIAADLTDQVVTKNRR
jgi:hypothetical protein